MNNDDILRDCENKFLDPDYGDDISISKWGGDMVQLKTCEICNERYTENEVLRVDGIDICEYCAEMIAEAWDEMIAEAWERRQTRK